MTRARRPGQKVIPLTPQHVTRKLVGGLRAGLKPISRCAPLRRADLPFRTILWRAMVHDLAHFGWSADGVARR